MRALLVVNPTATTTTPRTREVLASALASEVRLEVVETKRRGHAEELARDAAADGLDAVVALGGDGTVNEVVNGLLAKGPGPGVPVLGVVPGGSANVFARALGLPETPVEATSVLLEALHQGAGGAPRTRTLGLGRADGQWFTFCAGFGLDAAVVRRVDARRERGATKTPSLFVRTGLAEFFLGGQSREPDLVLEHPDGPVPLGLALICNTDPWTYLGPRPVHPCPDASFEGGLDLFGLRTLRTDVVLRHLAQILSARPRVRGRSVVSVHDAPEIVLSARRPVPFQVDGDDLGDRTRVHLVAVPDALRVLV